MQVILAVIIVALVATKLDDVTVSVKGTDVEVQSACSLGTSLDSSSLCVYVYVVVGISLLVSLIISILQCCTCNLCGLGKFLDVVFAAAGTVWWVIAAGVVQANVNDAQNLDLSLNNYRVAVVAMMWIEVGLFVLMVVSGLFRACSCLGGCCGDSKV